MSFTTKNTENRVRFCFDCHEFHLIKANDFKTNESLHNFELKHRGHRTQVIDAKVLAEILPNSQQGLKVW